MTTENSCNLTSADVSGEPYQSNTLDVTKCQRMMMRIYFMAQMIRAKVAISYLKVFVFAFSTRCEFQFQNFHLILLSHDLLTEKKNVSLCLLNLTEQIEYIYVGYFGEKSHSKLV